MIKNSNKVEENYTLSQPILDYLKNKFIKKHFPKNELTLYNYDELFWDKFLIQLEQKNQSSIEGLKYSFPQLNFPLSKEINTSENYKNATLRGDFSDIDISKNYLNLINTTEISVTLHYSFAGKIPIISIPNELDFETIIQALLYKNRFINIPKSMGAALINGINNWSRIKNFEYEWKTKYSALNSWQNDFKNKIVPYPTLYRDKLVIISRKPYSNVNAQLLQLDNSEWLNISEIIRIEHECTHLYTLNKYGSASNNLHDELIADYVGICMALGNFNKNWMLHFFGLNDYPKYKKGARLENYLGNIKIDSVDFTNLLSIINSAIQNIDLFDQSLKNKNIREDISFRIDALCQTNLLTIASSIGPEILLNTYDVIINFNVPLITAPTLHGYWTRNKR